jgi:outer membrane protein assembly complex protein YaeT
LWSLFLAGLAVPETSAQTPVLGNPTGPPVLSINFQPSEQPFPSEELAKLLPLHAGSPLKAEDVREAIRKLYATGRYSDISILSRPQPGGIAVEIRTSLAYFISGVTVDGAQEPPNKAQLVASTKLELGTAFQEDQLEPAVDHMQERLKANGFYNARIMTEVSHIDLTQEANIRFTVLTGDRARFAGVVFAGNFTKPKEALIRSTRWRRHFAFVQLRGWREVTDSLVQGGVGNLRKTFQKSDRLQAKVTLDDLDYDASTNAVTPSITIENGPLVEVQTTGAKVSKGRLRQLIPIYQERAVDRGLLLEGRRNLLEYFQAAGYFDASVDFEQHDEVSNQTLIDYQITRGDRSKLVSIEIHGNRFFDKSTLVERLSIRVASVIRYHHGRFSQRLLERDLDSIRDLYRSNGFRDVVATGQISESFKGKPGELGVDLEIMEGPQWRVGSLELTGIPEEDRPMLMGMLVSTPGQAFSEFNVASDRDSVLGFYYNNGYPDATFDWTQLEGKNPHEVGLRFVVKTGSRQFVRSVLVRGLGITNPNLVSNRISLKPGDPISQSQIGTSQQKLYDLGIFSKVETAIQNEDSPEDSKYVIFHMDEARKYSLNLGVGAQFGRIGGGTTTFDDPAGTTGFSPRVTVGLNRINFLGLGHTIGIQVRASTLEQRVLASYVAPQFTGKENTSLSFSGLIENSKDIRTFASRRQEGSVQLSQKLSRANTFQFRYIFRHVTIVPGSLVISPGLVPLLSQPVLVGSFSASFLQDRRDDPVNSTRGFYNSIDVGLAAKPFGSETDFTRVLIRNSTYYRIGKDLVLARTLQFGYIQRLGGLPEIPLAERFFSGGASTMRAFPDNQAGPRDLMTGFPLGGNALLFHQTELRFPLIGDNVGGVLFHDAGNVYDDIRDITIRFHQRNLQDFNYMVQAVGFGIRYHTPVGPVRLDLSYSPNSPRFFGFKGTLDELLNNQGTAVNQRINVFQFHFSLGQTF